MSVSSAISRTVRPSSNRALTSGLVHVLDFADCPKSTIVAKLELSLKGFGLVAMYAARLLEMNLEACALSRLVVSRTAQRKRRVEHILAC